MSVVADTAVLSNTEILHAIRQGHIVCHPFVPVNVRKASLDLTLGQWYFDTQQGSGDIPEVFNPFNKVDVRRYYGEPKRAKPWREYRQSFDGPLAGVPEDHPIILIAPRACILAHTHEFVGAKAELGTTMMKARSTWGRLQIEVCRCAGLGDPGYINRWTMEIQNNNDEYVPLPWGERIAQLVFFPTGSVGGGVYGNEADYVSKYQQSADIDDVIQAWTPYAMLPKAYKDDRVMPLPLDGESEGMVLTR